MLIPCQLHIQRFQHGRRRTLSARECDTNVRARPVQQQVQGRQLSMIPVHRVDAGYPKTLASQHPSLPQPPFRLSPSTEAEEAAAYAERKVWAVGFATELLPNADHPSWPNGKADDVADSALLGWWWLGAHVAGEGEAVESACPCCLRRYHTPGLDPKTMLTTGQLTVAVCKTELSCDEVELDAHGGWHVRKHRKPRFLPESTLPQSYDALAEALGVVDVREPPR